MALDDKIGERPAWHLCRILKPKDLWEYEENDNLQEFLGSPKFLGIQRGFYRSGRPDFGSRTRATKIMIY